MSSSPYEALPEEFVAVVACVVDSADDPHPDRLAVLEFAVAVAQLLAADGLDRRRLRRALLSAATAANIDAAAATVATLPLLADT